MSEVLTYIKTKIECTKNGCFFPSNWWFGNSYSVCEEHKEELENMFKSAHNHTKCDICNHEFEFSKPCKIGADHQYVCFVCTVKEDY